MLLFCNLIAFAGPFSDVPQGHWAFDAINSLTSKGIIKGYEDGTFGGNKVVSRYHLAVIISRMLASIEQRPEAISRADLKVVERLTIEFADELSLMNISVKSLEKELFGIKKDVSTLKTDIKNIKDFIKNRGNDNVKISGDILIRNYGSEIKNINNTNRNHRTESLFRIHLDTRISDKISAHSSWNLIENNNDRAVPFATNEWNGGNKNTGSIERAYFKLKNILNSNETIKIGRDWYNHGHGLVVHDFMDAISFSKPVKNADLAFNFFFDRKNTLNQKDYLNIWNINIDYYYRNQKLYLGFYYNKRAWRGSILANTLFLDEQNRVPLDKNAKDIRIEIGASGNLGKKNSGLTYDLAGVYNKTETIGVMGDPLAPTRKIDFKGWLTHTAIKYDKNKDFNFKLAYTYADDESIANIKRNDCNSHFMRDETPFDDLHYILPDNSILNNIKNYKAQVGFRLRNANKHSFRFAFDIIREDNSNLRKTNTNLITAEYRYQLSPNTRIRFLYQNAKDKEGGLFQAPPNTKTQLYMTEIYTRF